MTKKLLPRLVIGFLGLGVAEACGPDFEISMTGCGSKCLSQIRSRGILLDLAESVPEIKVHDSYVPYYSRPNISQIESGMSEPERKPLAAMRAEVSGDAAYAKGEGLREPLRLYVAGAIDFRRGHKMVDSGGWHPAEDADSKPKDDLVALSSAIDRFRVVLLQKSEEAVPQRLWAEYMLGRSLRLRAQDKDVDEAITHFEHVIAMVSAEQPDPMDLAGGALGELGGIALDRMQINSAAQFFARQASSADGAHGVDSLIELARRLLQRSDYDLGAALDKPLLQRLIVVYTFHRLAITCNRYGCSEDGDNPAFVVTLLQLVGELNSKKIVIPDRLAAVAYVHGDYELAERLAAMSTTRYGEWIKAKLALHRGDLAGAAEAYARADKLYAASAADNDVKELQRRLHTEQAMVSLSGKHFVLALEQLAAEPAGFTGDIGYLAERVLTIDELKAFGDSHPIPNGADPASSGAAGVRDILARRLSRAGRYVDAVQYYPKEATREIAKQYVDARKAAEGSGKSPERANGFFESARIEVEHGMEIRGTQLGPDYAIYGGNYSGGIWGPSDVASDDEKKRTIASEPEINTRFHYRTVATEHVIKAAELAPRHSELASAILCTGASWLRHHGETPDGDLVRTLFKKYQRLGKAAAWDRNFGAQCPEPDFNSSKYGHDAKH